MQYGEDWRMKKPDYWIDIYRVLKFVDWDKKPDAKHRPLIYADRPIKDDRMKELWLQSEGKPKRFARLIEAEQGIKEWEIEERPMPWEEK